MNYNIVFNGLEPMRIHEEVPEDWRQYLVGLDSEVTVISALELNLPTSVKPIGNQWITAFPAPTLEEARARAPEVIRGYIEHTETM